MPMEWINETFHVHYFTESTTAAVCINLFTFHLKNTKIFVGCITRLVKKTCNTDRNWPLNPQWC
jgi:hypothetical protein